MRRLKTTPATWTGQAIAATPGGGLALRIQIPRRGWLPSFTIEFRLTPDQAGVVHAQVDRLLTQGWARTETEREARQHRSSSYPFVVDAHSDQVRHTPEGKIQRNPPEGTHD